MIEFSDRNDKMEIVIVDLLHFESADEAWLDFVSDNRSGNYSEKSLSYLNFVGTVPQEEV